MMNYLNPIGLEPTSLRELHRRPGNFFFMTGLTTEEEEQRDGAAGRDILGMDQHLQGTMKGMRVQKSPTLALSPPTSPDAKLSSPAPAKFSLPQVGILRPSQLHLPLLSGATPTPTQTPVTNCRQSSASFSSSLSPFPLQVHNSSATSSQPLTTSDGNPIFNPALLLRKEESPVPTLLNNSILRTLTGSISQKKAQQILHERLQQKDIHGALEILPMALGSEGLNPTVTTTTGSSTCIPTQKNIDEVPIKRERYHPENILTVLHILNTSAPAQNFSLQKLAFVTHMRRETIRLVRAIFESQESSMASKGVDPLSHPHPVFGSWSALPNPPASSISMPLAGRSNSGLPKKMGLPPSPPTTPTFNTPPSIITTAMRGYLHLLHHQVLYLLNSHSYSLALTTAAHLLHLNPTDDFGMRFRIPVCMLKLSMPLQAVRFCLAWLDDTNTNPRGVKWDEAWEKEAVVGWEGNGRGKVGGVDLGLDMVQGKYQRGAFAMPGMAFLVGLGCWRVWKDAGGGMPGGVGSVGGAGGKGQSCCLYARSWLRLAHKANRHVLRILLSMIMLPGMYLGPTGYLSTRSTPVPLPSAIPLAPPLFTSATTTTTSISSPPNNPTNNTVNGNGNGGGGKIFSSKNNINALISTSGMDTYEEANDFLLITQNLFVETDEVKQWLLETMFSVVANTCLGCGKKEQRVGEHKACLGCRGEWYCGIECQRWAWGGHKRRCLEIRKARRLRELGRGL